MVGQTMMFEVSVEERATGRAYTIRSDKTTMFVSVMPSFVSTCVDNSSARVWRRGGRTFHGPRALEEAAQAYKSAECKAMVEAVREAEAARRGERGKK